MRVHFIRASKPRNMVLEELYTLLVDHGFVVSESMPEQGLVDLDLQPAHDLYVIKGRTPIVLSVAEMLHRRGARLLNPLPACAALLDKFVATAALRGAGIPTPRSWAAADGARLGPLLVGSTFPLIVKPYDGIGSRGVVVVRERAELERLATMPGPLLVQEYIDGCTRRYKVHVVGHDVFATWKPFSLGGVHDHSQPCVVSEPMRDLALRCGALFGLGLYGLDVLNGPAGPVVVDLNSFPGYGDVPGIGRVLAGFIERYARGRISLAAA